MGYPAPTSDTRDKRALQCSQAEAEDKRKPLLLIMHGKVLVAALALFLLYAVVAEGMSLSGMGSELRCQCISTYSKFIPPRSIQNVKLTQSGPHCQNVEIIATLKDGREVCLDPTAPWVKLIIKAILAKAQPNGETTL